MICVDAVLNPVVDVGFFHVELLQNVAEEPAQKAVVRLIVEPQALAVEHELCELLRHALTQNPVRGRELLLHDQIVLRLAVAADALPRQRALAEEDQNITQRDQVVAPALLHADHRVHARVADGAEEVLHLAVIDVVAVAHELAREPEVDHVDPGPVVLAAHAEVLRLHVAVEDRLLVDLIEALEHLEAQKRRGPERERLRLIRLLVQQRLQAWPEQI